PRTRAVAGQFLSLLLRRSRLARRVEGWRLQHRHSRFGRCRCVPLAVPARVSCGRREDREAFCTPLRQRERGIGPRHDNRRADPIRARVELADARRHGQRKGHPPGRRTRRPPVGERSPVSVRRDPGRGRARRTLSGLAVRRRRRRDRAAPGLGKPATDRAADRRHVRSAAGWLWRVREELLPDCGRRGDHSRRPRWRSGACRWGRRAGRKRFRDPDGPGTGTAVLPLRAGDGAEMSDQGPLIVPIVVEAFVVNDHVRRGGGNTFYRAEMQYNSLQYPANGQLGGGDDFSHGSSQYYNGVYLKWRLPDAFTQGVQDSVAGATAFPTVPNRWLVVRYSGSFAARGVTAWLIESDYRRAAPLENPPDASQVGSMYVEPGSGSDKDTLVGVRIGRNVPLASETWSESGATMKLSAVAAGNGAFAYYQPACNN